VQEIKNFMAAVHRDILILGIGNDILTDDAIGPKIVKRLQEEISSDNISFLTAAAGGLEILEMIKDFQQVVIIDAIKTRDGVPGTVYYLNPGNFKETLHISSFHDVSFLTALELAKKLEIHIPSRIDIIAVEIVEDLTFSNEFSKDIAFKYDIIYQEILESVNEIIAE
jgi:hydrogenase maturation protease